VVAVDVDDDAAAGPVDEDRQGGPQPDGEDLLPAPVARTGERTGDLGAQDPALLRSVGACVGRIRQGRDLILGLGLGAHRHEPSSPSGRTRARRPWSR